MLNSVLVLPLICACAVVAQVDIDFNFNPMAPAHLHSHIFMFGNGSVPVAEGPNPFANNALDGHEFLSQHLQWGEDMIEHRKSVSNIDILMFLTGFGLDKTNTVC